MRQITYDACQAFLNGETFHRDNTVVEEYDGVLRMRLWGHCIATRRLEKVHAIVDGEHVHTTRYRVSICNCGYETVTTKERLNGLLECMGDGRRIFQRAGVWYWVGKQWPEDEFPYDSEVRL